MTNQRLWQPVQSAAKAGSVGAYSPGAIAGDLIFTSGQIPQDPETGKVESDRPFTEQARRVLQNLTRVVEAAGSGVENIVSVTVYLADIADWAEFNQVYQEVFAPPFPARAVVGAQLANFRVEASAVAVRRRSA